MSLKTAVRMSMAFALAAPSAASASDAFPAGCRALIALGNDLFTVDGAGASQLTFDGAAKASATISPDGASAVFVDQKSNLAFVASAGGVRPLSIKPLASLPHATLSEVQIGASGLITVVEHVGPRARHYSWVSSEGSVMRAETADLGSACAMPFSNASRTACIEGNAVSIGGQQAFELDRYANLSPVDTFSLAPGGSHEINGIEGALIVGEKTSANGLTVSLGVGGDEKEFLLAPGKRVLMPIFLPAGDGEIALTSAPARDGAYDISVKFAETSPDIVEAAIAASPDGSQFAIASNKDDDMQLLVLEFGKDGHLTEAAKVRMSIRPGIQRLEILDSSRVYVSAGYEFGLVDPQTNSYTPLPSHLVIEGHDDGEQPVLDWACAR